MPRDVVAAWREATGADECQPLTLVQKWAQRTRALPGGHLVWTGERATGSRTPVLRYKERTFTAAAVAFRLGTGEDRRATSAPSAAWTTAWPPGTSWTPPLGSTPPGPARAAADAARPHCLP